MRLLDAARGGDETGGKKSMEHGQEKDRSGGQVERLCFDAAPLHTLLQGLRSTFREKLEWLEGAETLTLQLRGQREGRRAIAEDPAGYGKRRQ